MSSSSKSQVLEFFAGGGLARLGLAAHFDVVWANDFDPKKAQAYRTNFGDAGLVLGDVHDIDPATVPTAHLAWASFPCQDLSLAGGRAGLGAQRSGSFYGFVDVIKGLQASGRAPKVLVLENVSGLLTSRGGQDFVALMRVLCDLGYQAGAIEIDARYFLPQSRPRVFVVAVVKSISIPQRLRAHTLMAAPMITPACIKACHALPRDLLDAHVWWNLPLPAKPTLTLPDIIDEGDQNWWPQSKTDALLASFSARHRAMLADIQANGTLQIGAVYRRTRRKDGLSRPFAEIRFDGLTGCLRTPSGGSSRQFLLFVAGRHMRARPLNSREALRLMGVADTYVLPASTLAGLKIAGDGVAVPVVSWLSDHLLAPLLTD
jgi:DNA (cytosine-5)-methyltransferase 1